MEMRKWCEFAVISSLYLAVWLSFSIIVPFFPSEVVRKGSSQTAAGIVLGAFSITSLIVAAPIGSLVPKVGAKVMFTVGAGLCGLTNIIFGLVDFIDDGTAFVASALVLRIVEAVTSSAAIIAAAAIVGGNYTEQAPQMLGLLEMFSGLAFMIGPMIATFLFKAGGFKLPFFVLGGLCILLTALNGIVIHVKEYERSKEDSPSKLLRIPAIWLVAFSMFVTSACTAVFDLGIAYHTQKVGLLSTGDAGVVFFTQGGTYAICSAFFGWLINKLVKHFRFTTRAMLIIGFVFSAVSYMVIGPSTWLPFVPRQLWMLILSCVMVGLSMAVVCVSSIIDMVFSAEWHGLQGDTATYGMVYGVFLSCFHIGCFAGSVCGGALIDRYGFELTTSMFAIGCLVTAAVLAVFTAWEYQCGNGRRMPKKSSSLNGEEMKEQPTKPLLKD